MKGSRLVTLDSAQVQFVVTPPTLSPGSSASASEPEISNLCAVITGPASKSWLGRIASAKGQQHRIRAIDHQKRLPAFDTIRTVSLVEVLGDANFDQEQRLRLALKLASSVLQFHTTDWLTDYWNQSDISFLRSSYGVIDFDKPLIGRTFGTTGYSMQAMSQNLTRPMLRIHSLSFLPGHRSVGTTLSCSFWESQDGARTDYVGKTSKDLLPHQIPEISDLATARRLAYDIVASPNYLNAVLRCILGLDAAYRSLTETRFQDEVEDKIVFLLAEDLKMYCAKRSVEACYRAFRAVHSGSHCTLDHIANA